MKKKTKSKLNSSLFSLAFLISIFICIAGATGNGYLFYNSFFETLSKLNEDPIATISFKYNTAQRKFSDRTIWDRLRNNSPLYNGDTIHTSVNAEATVTFNDGNRVVLSENTMLQIYLNEDKTSSLMMKNGFAVVDTVEEGSGFEFVSNGNKIVLDSGSSMIASESAVEVLSGSASVADAEGLVKTIVQGEAYNVEEFESEVLLPKLVVTSPVPNQKILNHSEELIKVKFAWKQSNFPENALMLLEVAEDKDFEKIVNSTLLTSFDELVLNFNAGLYYWRIKTVNLSENIVVQSKFRIYQALAPSLISPVPDYTYSYRYRKPAVRFIWSESSQASSYRLVVSKNPRLNEPVINQRTNSTTSIISTLDEGTYYWQVTPYFSIGNEGFAASSEIHTFVIDKRGELTAPNLYLPVDNGIVDIQKDAKNAVFSWKAENEAVSYNVSFFNSETDRNPVKTYSIQDNFLSVKASDVFKQGKWYWSVTQLDEEGNVSLASPRQSFYAMEGKPEIRLVEPITGFRVAENLIHDQIFTWKKNLPDNMNTEIQFAKDPDFRNIVYSSVQNGYSFNGVNLSAGTYYWRMNSYSEATGLNMYTGGNQIQIVGNLMAPVLNTPTDRAVARETIPFTFSWDAVEDADYYKFTIYKGDEQLYDEVVYANETSVDLYNGEEFTDRTTYRWEVQAKANPIPGVVSRRNGNISEGEFFLIKLKPVEILTPKKNQVYDGIEAALNKVPVKWSALDKVSEAQIVIYEKTSNGRVAIYKNPSDLDFSNGVKIAPQEIAFTNQNLKEGGSYEVVVYAKTLDDIDISNTDEKYRGSFTILPIEPLPAPERLTSTPEKFDLEYLKNIDNPRVVELKWNKIKNANGYIVEIRTENNELIIHEELKDVTNYSINWIDLINAQEDEKSKKRLYNGTFTWTVEGIRKVDTDNDGIDDTAIQPGLPAMVNFTTSIPVSKSASGKGTKRPYGK